MQAFPKLKNRNANKMLYPSAHLTQQQLKVIWLFDVVFGIEIQSPFQKLGMPSIQILLKRVPDIGVAH